MRATGIALVLAWMYWGCNSAADLRAFCTGNDQCPAGFRCAGDSGLCLCAADEACPGDEFCAPDGRCRPRMGCDNNLDCPAGTFCDTFTGNCSEEGKCTQDFHCALGQICAESFSCVRGCRIHGDCPLGDLCRAGKCQGGLCDDQSFCRYGQLCDAQTSRCLDDDRGPFCQSCASATLFEPSQCGDGPNFCLVTGGDLTLSPYCGVDCGLDQSCPQGYSCGSVRIVYSRDNCHANQECSSGLCLIREGDDRGFCLCTADAQCPQDQCDATTRICLVTRRPCPLGNECDRPIHCIDGFCHIGYNCKPIEGLRCEDLLP